MRILVGLMILSLHAATTTAADALSLKVYSAGSLRAPLTEITAAYTATYASRILLLSDQNRTTSGISSRQMDIVRHRFETA